MIPMVLIIASTLVWQEDFTEGVSTLSQLYDYTVEIVHQEGLVKLTANPQFEGFAAAWMYLDENVRVADATLHIRIKVNTSAVRLRYFFRKEQAKYYHAGEYIIEVSEGWQDVNVPLRYGRPFYGSEFPRALTPGKNPAVYLFIENAMPGYFQAELDRISINSRSTHREQK
jgi:hypothetical protein